MLQAFITNIQVQTFKHWANIAMPTKQKTMTKCMDKVKQSNYQLGQALRVPGV
jgi:hypothetical protein